MYFRLNEFFVKPAYAHAPTGNHTYHENNSNKTIVGRGESNPNKPFAPLNLPILTHGQALC